MNFMDKNTLYEDLATLYKWTTQVCVYLAHVL